MVGKFAGKNVRSGVNGLMNEFKNKQVKISIGNCAEPGCIWSKICYISFVDTGACLLLSKLC